MQIFCHEPSHWPFSTLITHSCSGKDSLFKAILYYLWTAMMHWGRVEKKRFIKPRSLQEERVWRGTRSGSAKRRWKGDWGMVVPLHHKELSSPFLPSSCLTGPTQKCWFWIFLIPFPLVSIKKKYPPQKCHSKLIMIQPTIE